MAKILSDLQPNLNKALQEALNSPKLTWEYRSVEQHDHVSATLCLIKSTVGITIPVEEGGRYYNILAKGWVVGGHILDQDDLNQETLNIARAKLSSVLREATHKEQSSLISRLEGIV